ncbi:hypothetical protein PoB_004003800 [Plakobranchus ocellatus]|uniref:Uncharacterized protein n=1 Tax=Plakobranchus ocellatus TaxID=259542 RepID=A0AAV4B343_9GAST|nr:hypothetical protein PoB_004003800 [Plakobranchus ocellatus]
MPTEIKIVLPDTGIDDNLSTTTDADNYDSVSHARTEENFTKDVDTDNNTLPLSKTVTQTAYTNGISNHFPYGNHKKISMNGHGRHFLYKDFDKTAVNGLDKDISLHKVYNHDDNQCDSDHNHRKLQEETNLSAKSPRTALLHTQHHLLDGDLLAGQGPSLIVLDNNINHGRALRKSNSATNGLSRKIQRPKTADSIATRGSKGFQPSITESYGSLSVYYYQSSFSDTNNELLSPDVDLEHNDIMKKALQSYSQYRGRDADSERMTPQTGTPVWDDRLSHLAQNASSFELKDLNFDRQARTKSRSQSAGLERSTPGFKLAQCRLRYYDDNEEDNNNRRRRKRSILKQKKVHAGGKTTNDNHPQGRQKSARPVVPPPVLYPREERDGVLVDAIGHIYRASETSRPRSAVHCKTTDFVRLSNREFGLDRQTKSAASQTASSGSKVQPVRRPQSGFCHRPARSNTIDNGQLDNGQAISNRPNSTGSQSLKVVNLRLDGTSVSARGNMAGQPIPHSVAYQRRNRTTHAWGDSSCLSHSLPSSNFLHRNYGSRSVGGSSASSPRSIRGDSGPFSERTSPAGKPTDTKPSASYSYDGGFFVGAHANQAEYFVIHPDWVSEVMTIKKLSVSSVGPGRKSKGGSSGPPLSHSAQFRPRSLQGRRCLSAPPEKRRNPITWDPGFLADASNFDACDNTRQTSQMVNGDK